MRHVDRRLVLSAAAATSAANLSWWMQPLIVHDLMTDFHATEAAAALLVTAEFIAIAIAPLLLAKFAHKVRYRSICIAGAVFMVLGSFGTLVTHNYYVMLGVRAATGVGEGTFLMISTAAVAHLPNTHRVYAQLNVVNIICGAALSLGIPPLMLWFTPSGLTLRVMAIVLTVLAMTSLVMPASERYEPPTQAGHDKPLSGRVVAIALAAFFSG